MCAGKICVAFWLDGLSLSFSEFYMGCCVLLANALENWVPVRDLRLAGFNFVSTNKLHPFKRKEDGPSCHC